MSIRVRISDWWESSPMNDALKQLEAVDTKYDFQSMRRQWGKWGRISPKQASLVIWRLQVHDVVHDPETLGLRLGDGEKDREQFAAMAPWQQKRLLPYLSPEQLIEFGF